MARRQYTYPAKAGMIQYRAKNRYWQGGRRWFRMVTPPTNFDELRFEDYDYIIGDKIFTEPNDEANNAFDMVMMWSNLH